MSIRVRLVGQRKDNLQFLRQQQQLPQRLFSTRTFKKVVYPRKQVLQCKSSIEGDLKETQNQIQPDAGNQLQKSKKSDAANQQKQSQKGITIQDFVNLMGESFSQRGLPHAKYKSLKEVIQEECDERQWDISEVRRDNARIISEILYRTGISIENLKYIAQKRPSLFFCSLQMIYKKSKYYIEEIGLQKKDLCKLLIEQPRCFEYSIQSIQKKVEYLKSIGMTDKQICILIKNQPNILNHGLVTLKNRVKLIQENCEFDDLKDVFQKCPEILTFGTNILERNLKYFREKIKKQKIYWLVVKHPRVLHYQPKSIEIRIQFFIEIGFTEKEAWDMFINFPQLMCLNIQTNLRPKFQYFTEKMGYSIKELKKFPGFFSLSLNQRIIPRHEFNALVRKKSNKEFTVEFPLHYLKKSDDTFLEEIEGDFEEYQEFKTNRINQLQEDTSQFNVNYSNF